MSSSGVLESSLLDEEIALDLELEYLELERLIRAHDGLADFVRSVDVPGAPPTEEDAEDEFYPVRLEPAAHHLLMIDLLERVERGELKRLMILMGPGTAKALALDTPIPTPTGWSTMRDLAVGDKVFDENGQPCRITRKSPIWKDRPIYKVKTDCGDEILADADHEWMVRICGKRQNFKLKRTALLASKNYLKNPVVKRARPLEMSDQPLPIDPYVLGVWLGDGTSESPQITCGDQDAPWMMGELQRLGIEVSKQNAKFRYGLLGIRKHFVDLGLLGNKHIPIRYLFASRNQRQSLLQGLVDTDATVAPNGCVCFTSTKQVLSLGVQHLVRSLGAKASVRESRARVNGKDCGPIWRVWFYLRDAARMPRKSSRCRNNERTPDTYLSFGPAGRSDTVCISVDSPSRLFLCGKSMTPTHNSTYVSVCFPAWYLARQPRRSLICTSYGSNLPLKFGRRCRNLVDSHAYREIFGLTLAPGTKAANNWATSNGSEYMSAGILAGITGNRVDGGIADDLIKGREAADSQIVRDKTWEAWISDFRPRLKPGGWLVFITTRWHEDDPAGRILPADYDGRTGWIRAQDGETWYVLCLQSECERDDDPLGRQKGEYIWPDWFPREYFEQEKITQGPRNWSALHQQTPHPERGNYFRREWIRYYDWTNPPLHMRKYGASDYAVSEGKNDWTVHGIIGIDPNDDIYVVDWWREQSASNVWVEVMLDLVQKHRPIEWEEEAGQIEKGVGPFLTKRMQERKPRAYVARNVLTSSRDKATRAQSIRGRMAQGKVYFPMGAPWTPDLVDRILRFRGTGDEVDDDVDVLSLFGRMLDELNRGHVPATPKSGAFNSPAFIRDQIKEMAALQKGPR